MNLKTILTLIIISTLIILSAGCITEDNTAEIKKLELEVSNLTTDRDKTINECIDLSTQYIDDCVVAEKINTKTIDDEFEIWDIETDKIISSYGIKEDKLYIEYLESSMTDYVYTARYEALENEFNREYNILDRAYDRSVENADKTLYNNLDNLETDYRKSMNDLKD